jgi:hypothetical protein
MKRTKEEKELSLLDNYLGASKGVLDWAYDHGANPVFIRAMRILHRRVVRNLTKRQLLKPEKG